MNYLSRIEEVLLLAIWKLKDNAYGISIREQVEKDTGVEWMSGAIYAPLHRLEKKGLVRTMEGEPVAERGGRRKIFYIVTEDGKRALAETKRVHESIWTGAPELGLDKA